MKLVEQHIVLKSNSNWKRIDELCFFSKNLYNSALYEIKKNFQETGKFLRYKQLESILKNKTEFNDYRTLTPVTAQQTLLLLDKNLKSYFALLRKWKKNKNSLTGCPQFPKYKHKTRGRNPIILTASNSLRYDGDTIIFPNALKLNPIKTKIKNTESIKQLRIIPRSSHYVIEIIYEVENSVPVQSENYAAIDLGINNLVTLVQNKSTNPIIVNGKPIKSMNKYWNKLKAKTQSQLEKNWGKRSSNRLNKLSLKRNNKIKDYLHKSSRFIVNYLVENRISTLVIGHNAGWKDETNLGKKMNQTFVQIPHTQLINMLRYKAELVGIKVIEVKEHYTSKVSAFEYEPIAKREKYLGQRTKRGLFLTSSGFKINADVNGAFNIGRKVIGDEFIPADIGLVVNPIKVTPL